jgi:simple sugar transport system permease protein
VDFLVAIVVATVAAGTPLALAALGELVTERSGVLNLGVEGMMLAGAVAGFAAAATTGNLWLGAACGVAAGIALSFVFAVAVVTLQANQVATGLALAIFGGGLSAFAGQPFVSQSIDGIRAAPLPLLGGIPVLGPLVFSFDPLVYLSLALFVAVVWFLARTRAGLVLRAVGESPEVAHEVGYSVAKIRYAATLFGGAMAGLAGAYLSLAYTPLWVEGLTAGRGWIALALVVFATWRPARVLAGAYLFGGVTVLQFHAQGFGVAVPAQFLSALPYLATIVVLVIISRDAALVRLNAPASLGKPFHAGD